MPVLRHPDLPPEQVVEVDESRVDVMAKSGWVPIDETPTPEPESRTRRGSTPAPDPVPDPADPASAGTHEE